MTPESLFLSTIDDLDQRLELGRGEYDALCMAWLLRKLFRGGARSLVSLVDPEGETEPAFTVWAWEVAPTHHGWVPLSPTAEYVPTAELTLAEFLRRTCVVVWEENNQSRRHEISIRDLIDFLANNWGAVHLSRPNAASERALWDFCWDQSVTTADGQYTGGVFCLIEVARVARLGLEPLRERLDATVSYVERKTGVNRRRAAGSRP